MDGTHFAMQIKKPVLFKLSRVSKDRFCTCGATFVWFRFLEPSHEHANTRPASNAGITVRILGLKSLSPFTSAIHLPTSYCGIFTIARSLKAPLLTLLSLHRLCNVFVDERNFKPGALPKSSTFFKKTRVKFRQRCGVDCKRSLDTALQK